MSRLSRFDPYVTLERRSAMDALAAVLDQHRPYTKGNDQQLRSEIAAVAVQSGAAADVALKGRLLIVRLKDHTPDVAVLCATDQDQDGIDKLLPKILTRARAHIVIARSGLRVPDERDGRPFRLFAVGEIE